MRQVDEDRVAELAERAARVADVERRRGFHDIELREVDEDPGRVGIGDADARRRCRKLSPLVREAAAPRESGSLRGSVTSIAPPRTLTCSRTRTPPYEERPRGRAGPSRGGKSR